MIEHIRTVGFKGFDLDEDIPQKVIYTGKNKSGKSSRAGAIAIAIYGYIPFSTSGKRPSDILDSYGDDSLICAVTIGGIEFARKFSRNEKGSVSQGFQYDKKRASAENFAIMLNKAGCPRIADTAEFMKQSEAKKVDTLFELFPNPELAGIDNEIEDAKEDVSRLETKKKGAESVVVRLTNSKKEIQLPSGSIAEIQAEIKATEFQIEDLERQIKMAEIEEAEIKATEKAKEEAEKVKIKAVAEAEAEGKRKEKERAEIEAAEKLKNEQIQLKTNEDWSRHDLESKSIDPKMVGADQMITKMENSIDSFAGDTPFKFNGRVIDKKDICQDPSGSIQRIIEALMSAGCNTCAALIVAKQELKKFKAVL